MKLFLKQLERSWLAANVAGANGGITALSSFLGSASGHAVGIWMNFNVAVLTWKQAISIFLGAFLFNFFDYYRKNPLAIPDSESVSSVKSVVKTVALLLLVSGLCGCETYKKCPVTPDGFNYTLSRSRETGELTDYWGFTWNLKP